MKTSKASTAKFDTSNTMQYLSISRYDLMWETLKEALNDLIITSDEKYKTYPNNDLIFVENSTLKSVESMIKTIEGSYKTKE